MVSLDRFFLPHGWLLFLHLMCITMVAGMLLSVSHNMAFYAMLMVGFFLAVLSEKFVFADADLKSEVVCGLLLIIAALFMMLRMQSGLTSLSHYVPPVLFGLGIGIIGSRFLLFFIGAPLGALIRKGGLGTPAVVSILFFVLYWVVDITGTKLARDGATSPVFGNFISALVLAPIGGFLTWKAIQDATLFNTDGIKTWWRKTLSKIMSFFKKTRIVYMGTPEFAVAPLDALVRGGYKVVGVVTVADKPSGRGLKVNESAVKKYAVAHEIPILQPDKLKDPAFLQALAAWKADLFVVVGFRMLPEEVWNMPKLGTFNLHAALLPQYRGAAPINWAVINGEALTGVTTFMIDKQIDTGGVILRQECRISPTDTAGDVHDKLMGIGAELVVETVEGLIQKNVETRVQRSFIQGSEQLKPAPKLTRELCHIDWNDTTRNIYNLVRGLSPFPGAYTVLVKDGTPTQLKIYFGEMRDDLHAAPGTVLSDGKTYLAIATADGALSLKDIQLAGKKRMGVEAFLLGFRDPEAFTTEPGTSKAEIAKTKPTEA